MITTEEQSLSAAGIDSANADREDFTEALLRSHSREELRGMIPLALRIALAKALVGVAAILVTGGAGFLWGVSLGDGLAAWEIVVYPAAMLAGAIGGVWFGAKGANEFTLAMKMIDACEDSQTVDAQGVCRTE